MSASRTLTRHIRLSTGAAFVFTIFLSAAPGVATAQEVEFISNFQVVSATIDHDTNLPTITFAFDCLAAVPFVELPSILVQQRGHKLARSFQPGPLFRCQAGTTVTVDITYGFQGGSRFKPGPAELVADVFANNEGLITVDFDSIETRVLLHPQK